MRLALAALVLVLASCGRYAEFSLPPPPPSKAFQLTWIPHPSPVLTRGQDVDVLNPSVAAWQGQLWNLYSRFDGRAWHTAMATSTDGLTWRNPKTILSPSAPWESNYIAANGAVIAFQNELLYVYQAGPKGKTVLGLARSRDGANWTKHPAPVLTQGPWRSWDEISLGDPYLIEAHGQLYLFYLGEDRAHRQRLGIARSADGVTWTRLRTNPILELGGFEEFDENGLGEPAVFAANNSWLMLYTGRDRHEKRALGYASSTDGKLWTKLKAPVLRGDQPWNQQVLCDPTVIVEPDKVRIWFGGGDSPKPDERLNGQIGYSELPLAAAQTIPPGKN
jgi:predicted GH43/DUF377 family glycosyl hydrolase